MQQKVPLPEERLRDFKKALRLDDHVDSCDAHDKEQVERGQGGCG